MSQSEQEGRLWERIGGSIRRAWEKLKRRCPATASLIEYVCVLLTGRLKPHQALARLSMVALIQCVGVSLTFWLIEFFPRHFNATYEGTWQNDCLVIARVLAGMGFLLLVTSVVGYLTFSWRFFAALVPAIAEGGILLTFGANIILFSLAMMRTGGPAHSFFAQLVPMQLSGILILDQQRAMMTSKKLSPRWRALLYAAFTIVMWLIIVWFREQVQWLLGWSRMMIEGSLETYEMWTSTILFALGIIVTACAYWGTPLLAVCIRRKQTKKSVDTAQQPS